MSTMEEQRRRIVSMVKEWDLLEQESSEAMEQIKTKCDNPLVCLVMEVIEHDVRLHRRLQSFILHSLEREPLTLSPDEVGEVIGFIRNYTALKSRMVAKVEKTLAATTDKSLHIQEFLMKTLLVDERKHKEMLKGIEKVMQGLYPYWPH